MSHENNQIELEEESSTNTKIKAAIIALLLVLGMIGLCLHVDYSGWVLFVGLIGAFDFL